MKLNCLLLTLLLLSCTAKKPGLNILSGGGPEQQMFIVNIHADTTLVTKSGCIIRLKKDDLESDSDRVKLEIREAITMEDIVLSGMTTQAGGQSLSSGGMIYFNAAAGYSLKIKNAVEVLVPTTAYNRDMKVFKGEEEGGKINWKDPQPLPADSTTMKIDNGKVLFQQLCSSCHKIAMDFTAPALAGVTYRRPKEWLYGFTRHSEESVPQREADTTPVDAPKDWYNDPYVRCLRAKFGPVAMPPFPDLTDTDLDNIYAYIKSESDKIGNPKDYAVMTCCDSCEAALKLGANIKYEDREFFTLDRTIPLPAVPTSEVSAPPIQMPQALNQNLPPSVDPVKPRQAIGTYYSIKISAVGWYNIDILLKEISECKESELFVRIREDYKTEMNVVLAIPQVKAFLEGGKLKNGSYGFGETNGKVPLPQGAECYVMAFGEYEKKLLFGKAKFIASPSQTIDLTVSAVTEQQMVMEIKALKLEDVTAAVKQRPDSVVKQLQIVEKMIPKNCDCGLMK